LLEAALRHQSNGDYDEAIAAYRSLLEDSPAPTQVRKARYRLGECALLNREYVVAAAAWEEFLAAYPDDERLPQATLMAARAYHGANECDRAISHYQAYLDHETVLADIVHEWIGDCHAAGAELEEAIAAYRRALDISRDRSVHAGLREKIAGAYLALEQYNAAVGEYDAILDLARIDDYRAKIEYLAGQALVAAGETEAAYIRYQRAVKNYPKAEHAYLSLVELVDAGTVGEWVDEFQRGLVDYYAGDGYPDAYGAAVRAFARYLGAEPAERVEEALYFKALAQRALGEHDAALETLEVIIASYPESRWVPRAWLEQGAILAQMDETDEAVRVYQNLTAFFPAHELAPQALWRAAKLRETQGAHADAAELFEKVQTDFPSYEDADEALWRAGLARYQTDALDEATADWQALLEKYPKSPYRAKTLYWLGKIQRAECQAQDVGEPCRVPPASWDQLVAEDPQGYYALRVEQMRTGESLTVTRLITAAVESPAWEATQTQIEIEAWLRDWTQAPTSTNLITLPVSVTRSLDFQRGQVLLAVGLRREALQAFDKVRAAAWKEPLWLAPLAVFFHDRGLHGMAARCAYRLAGLWPEGTIREAPPVLQRLAYPLPYAGLLVAESKARALDPLLLAALIRQESLFEPVAESYAGARGLGQVMPATGEGIARSLEMEDFVLDDLYRPSVSVRFGAFYLAVQLDRFDGQLLVALAAYNGGPGNVLRWLEMAGTDLDLFVEVITATQSRLYLQRVYEQYVVYEALYRPAED
jgi:soluble lytic murein transglycosylase